MTLKDDPDLTDALDGLVNATRYADSIEEHQLARDIAGLYQELAKASPDEQWENRETDL